VTTPRVTEMPLRLEPVLPDPFIGPPSRSSAVPFGLTENEAPRRTERLRRVMPAHAADPAARAGTS
jgi:hypothetical protein